MEVNSHECADRRNKKNGLQQDPMCFFREFLVIKNASKKESYWKARMEEPKTERAILTGMWEDFSL